MANIDRNKLERVLEHLFKKHQQRDLVRAVVLEGISAYEAERRYNVTENTGTRYTNKYEKHIQYLKSLGLEL